MQTAFDEVNGRLSPDGRWMAYASDETGRKEVYLRAIEGPGRTARVSTDGGEYPAWGSDGRELFYVEGRRKLMRVALDASGGPSPGRPAPLFEARFGPSERSPYAVGADGRRILVNLVVGQSEPSPITVVVNWPALAAKR